MEKLNIFGKFKTIPTSSELLVFIGFNEIQERWEFIGGKQKKHEIGSECARRIFYKNIGYLVCDICRPPLAIAQLSTNITTPKNTNFKQTNTLYAQPVTYTCATERAIGIATWLESTPDISIGFWANAEWLLENKYSRIAKNKYFGMEMRKAPRLTGCDFELLVQCYENLVAKFCV